MATGTIQVGIKEFGRKQEARVVPLTENTLPVRFEITTDLDTGNPQFSYWDAPSESWVCLAYVDLKTGETKVQTSLSEMEII